MTWDFRLSLTTRGGRRLVSIMLRALSWRRLFCVAQCPARRDNILSRKLLYGGSGTLSNARSRARNNRGWGMTVTDESTRDFLAQDFSFRSVRSQTRQHYITNATMRKLRLILLNAPKPQRVFGPFFDSEVAKHESKPYVLETLPLTEHAKK